MKKGSQSYSIYRTLLGFGVEVTKVWHKGSPVNKGFYCNVSGKKYFLGYTPTIIRQKLQGGYLDDLKQKAEQDG